MKAVNEILSQSKEFLESKGLESPRRLAELMLSSILNLSRMDLYLDFERPLDENEMALCRIWLKRLGKGEPIQYIQGSVAFYNCEIKVDPSVLIPRPETEELVDLIINDLKTRNLEGKKLWDVCAGSGCIGIAIKKALPMLDVTLSDISSDACKVARENARTNNVEVAILEGDLFAAFGKEKADFIVSNPPYVTESEYLDLSLTVKDHEPRGALVGGEDGLDVYRRIAKELKTFINPKGALCLEIGCSQKESVKKIFKGEGFSKIDVKLDIAGKNRFLFLE